MTLRAAAAKRVARAITGRQGVLGYLLSDERVLKYIDDRPDILLRILKTSEVLPQLLAKPGTLDMLGLDEATLQRFEPQRRLDSVDDDAILTYLKDEIEGGTLAFDRFRARFDIRWILDHVGHEQLLKHLGPERMLTHLGPERMLSHLGPEQMLSHLGPEQMLNHLSPEQMLNHLSPEQMLNHLSPEQMLNHLGPERAVQNLEPSQLLGHLDASHPQVLGSLIENDKAFSRLMHDERAIRKVCLDESLKRRFRFVDAKRTAAALPYRLPGLIVSYPRSGSNFVQSVLRHSSGLTNLSIYAPNPDGIDITLTLKSHAPSPAYLRDEFGRIVGEPEWPARIVLLQRDPRDVMISFYEYTQFMRQTTIPQEDFLNTCFFYASAIDRDIKRRVDVAPMSVLQAYQKHVKEWFNEQRAAGDYLIVRYEDLVTAPEEGFQRIFDYLNLDCPLATEFLDHEVSRYDDTRQHRAKATAWKEHSERYRSLLETIDTKLGDETRALGYGPLQFGQA